MARVARDEAEMQSASRSLQEVGTLLREAREARNLNVEDVAARLRLDARTIRNMEEGAFERLPAPTYARGYLRSYANFLGLAADSLLLMFEQHADQPPDIKPYASAPHREIRATDLPVRAVTYMVIAVLVGLLGIWLWQNHQLSSLASLSVPKWGQDSSVGGDTLVEPVVVAPRPAENTSGSAAANAQSPGFDYSYPTVNHPRSLDRPAATPGAGESGGAAASPSGAASIRLAEPSATLGTETAAERQRAAAGSPSADGPGAAIPGTVPQAPAAGGDRDVMTRGLESEPAPASEPIDEGEGMTAMAPAPLPMVSPPGDQVLTLELAEDAWVEVVDAERNRLYYNLGRQGSRISIQGVLPYTVKVGNADAVSVSYEGRSLDIGSYSYEAVARFKVMPEGALAQP